MGDAARTTGARPATLEDQHVAAARRLGLDEIRALVDRQRPKDSPVEAQRPLRIPDGQCDVCEARRS